MVKMHKWLNLQALVDCKIVRQDQLHICTSGIAPPSHDHKSSLTLMIVLPYYKIVTFVMLEIFIVAIIL